MTLRVGSTALLSLLLAISAICMPQSQDSAKPASGKTAASKPADNEDPPESQKMEAGKYMVLSEDGIGPFIPAVFGFTESWTLWRLKDGSYEEKGERGYRSPSAETHQESFATHLAPDFHVLSIQYFGLLRSASGCRADHLRFSSESAFLRFERQRPAERCPPGFAHARSLWFRMADLHAFSGGHHARSDSRSP